MLQKQVYKLKFLKKCKNYLGACFHISRCEIHQEQRLLNDFTSAMRRHTEHEKEVHSTLQRQVEELQSAAGENRLIEIEQNESTGRNIEGEQG